jgi:predicted ATP-dependent protease
VPKTNLKDIIIDREKMKKINIIPVETMIDVLKVVLDWSGKQSILRKITAAD